MKLTWICWTVFALIVGSVLYELVTKTARVRGIEAYTRNETPWGYWLVLLAKGVPRCPDRRDCSHIQYLKPLPQHHSDISACRLFLHMMLRVTF